MSNLKTRIHQYRFDLRNASEKAAWDALRASLAKTHPRCMESHGGSMHYMPEWGAVRDVELETAHLFDNQWNTAPIPGLSDKGYRVFDWALDYMPGGNPHIKQGHWIEQTPAMREARRNTDACGYCGKQEPAAKGYVFCPHCIGSAYLAEKDLPLTRMQSVAKGMEARAPLTDAERAHLMPLYVAAQMTAQTERQKAAAVKERADTLARYAKAIRKATNERDGKLWLLDKGFPLDNVIYYDHAGRFCFGWRRKLDGAVLAAVLDMVSEFPYPYTIECTDGRTLQGE